MGDLHDALESGGYSGHELERLLVRILFCLFAEDTGIFERDAFTLFLENHTAPDGSDLGPQLARLFQVLNTPRENRQKNLLEELAALPYVNGELFAESLSFAEFNSDMRNRLLACTRFDWSRISPAVFGALFQAVMEPRERRQIGGHYTSERDILKVIGPLFLDDLKVELEKAGSDARKLNTLHDRLGTMRLLDPACGCGNFLVIAYRELRLLELEILRRLFKKPQMQKRLDINTLLKLDVDQLYGIEIEEWPVRIAEVAMWLMDHQMNQRVSEEFGEYFVRLPLRKSPHIHLGNALRIDWNDVLPAEQCTHVLGNPPFVGEVPDSNPAQRNMRAVWRRGQQRPVCSITSPAGISRRANTFKDTPISCRLRLDEFDFPGRASGPCLWKELLRRGAISIHFAHRTFRVGKRSPRQSARSRRHHRIRSLAIADNDGLFEYESVVANRRSIKVASINPYLVEGPNVLVIANRSKPLVRRAGDRDLATCRSMVAIIC